MVRVAAPAREFAFREPGGRLAGGAGAATSSSMAASAASAAKLGSPVFALWPDTSVLPRSDTPPGRARRALLSARPRVSTIPPSMKVPMCAWAATVWGLNLRGLLCDPSQCPGSGDNRRDRPMATTTLTENERELLAALVDRVDPADVAREMVKAFRSEITGYTRLPESVLAGQILTVSQ